MRATRWATLTALAESQHGLVTTAQAAGADVSARSLQRAVAAGLLMPVRRGVLRVAGSPPSPWRDVMAACLAAGGDALASHRTAGALHGLPVAAPVRPEVLCDDTVADGLTGVTCHRTRRLPDHQSTAVANVPCTTIQRTIVDLAGVVDRERLAGLVDDADRRRLCRPGDVERCLDEVGSRGRRGAANLRAVLADRGAAGVSPLEGRWLRRLRAVGLRPPAVQHQLVVRGRVLLLDAAWPDQRVGLELDGWDPHRTRGAFDGDAERTNLLVEADWRVVHATSRSSPELVIAQLRRLLAG
ncbi:MAG: type IV toxin-antitoxin system AbiEi family antitoxin domain-containing protein [Acidimicrobiales bacterium]